MTGGLPPPEPVERSRCRQAADITVVIPARNEEGMLPLTLPTVLAAMDALPAPAELVVVTPPWSPLLREPPLRDVRLRWRAVERAGKFAALRVGVQASECDLLLMLDADVLVEERALSQLVRPLRDGSADVASGRIAYLSAPRRPVQSTLDEWSLVSADAWDLLRTFHADLRWALPGAMYAIRRSLFPPEPLVPLVDDASIGLHALEAGASFAYVPDAAVWTCGPASCRSWLRAKLRSRRGWAALAALRAETVAKLETTLHAYVRTLAGQARLGGLMLAQDRLLRLLASRSLRAGSGTSGVWEPARDEDTRWSMRVTAQRGLTYPDRRYHRTQNFDS